MNLTLPFVRMDDFTLISLIQEGPFSLTVLGYQESLKRVVFLKLLKPTIKDQPQWLERFTREAQVCAQLKNPNIVNVYLIGEYLGYTYMAMEYVQGLSLKNILTSEKKLPQEIAFSILLQILSALSYVHQRGIIHRDIKPGNIMLDIFGVVRLTDFGLAYLGEDTSVTQSGTILGTPAYMCPEQIHGEKVHPQSDFFSLGSTLYEMITGEKAFSGSSYSVCIQKILNKIPPPPSKILPNLQPGTDEFIFWFLEKELSSRPGSVPEILSKMTEWSFNFNAQGYQQEIGILVQKYYEPPAVFQGKLQGKPDPVNRERESQKNIFSSRWMTLFIIFLVGFLSVMIVIFVNGNDEAEQPLSSPQNGLSSVESTSIKMPDISREIQSSSGEKTVLNRSKESVDIDTFRYQSMLTAVEENKTETDVSAGVGGSGNNDALSIPKPGTLETKTAVLDLQIIPWGSVKLDGMTIDSLFYKKELILSPGQHQIILSHPEFPPKLIDLQLAVGQTKVISYSFLENSGYLDIEVRPWAEVHIDGRYIDTTPLRQPLILSAANHFLELKHPSYPVERQIVTISVNETLRVRKNFHE